MVLMVMEMLVELVVRLMVERVVVMELEGVRGQSHHVRIPPIEPTLLTL